MASSTSDRERLFILASYYDVVQEDSQKAIETYEILLRLYPENYWAASNLNDLYLDTGRADDAWHLAVRLARLRPENLKENELAACGMYLNGDPLGAAPFVQRVRGLAASDPQKPFTDEPVELLPAFYSWVQGDVTKARAQVLELEKSHKDFDCPYFLWSLGELNEAEKRMKARYRDRHSASERFGILIARATKPSLRRLVQ